MVRITDFGNGRFEASLSGGTATLNQVLGERGIETGGRRVAVNGHPASLDTKVREGDEVSIVPRVQGG